MIIVTRAPLQCVTAIIVKLWENYLFWYKIQNSFNILRRYAKNVVVKKYLKFIYYTMILQQNKLTYANKSVNKSLWRASFIKRVEDKEETQAKQIKRSLICPVFWQKPDSVYINKILFVHKEHGWNCFISRHNLTFLYLFTYVYCTWLFSKQHPLGADRTVPARNT